MIDEALAGRRIFVTGATGFVGTALVERLLRCVPDAELVLLVRDGRRSSARRRVDREVLRNDCFDRLRSELGTEGFDRRCEQVHVVAGDVGTDGLGLGEEGRRALADCDVVIHSAATVAFDSPLDAAVEVNLMGPVRIAQTLEELGASPHLVTVSTCYVAGNRRGSAPEVPVEANPFFAELDWRAEVEAARRTRADTDAASREPERLSELARRARHELGPAGGPILAERTERLRREWVRDRLVEMGRARAASVGWPDAYAFTKALGEVALGETLRARGEGAPRLSIVRPSIIESALAEPRPGWIRGFRMAEPIILSYARGLLREFPGVPEGVVDVIPVDLVVAAIVVTAAADVPAARGLPAGTGHIVQVASGSENPLRYQRLVDRVREWFTEHPLHDRHGQPIVVPDWNFPGRGKVESQLERSEAVLRVAERVASSLPLRGRAAQFGASLEERRAQLDRASTYVELYGAYTECEAVYGVEHLLALHDALDDDERVRFGLDPGAVDWDHYITGVHLPSVVEHGRARSSATRTSPTARSDRLRARVLDPQRHLAAFDLENTLIASNVVTSYSWLATRRLSGADRLRFTLRTLAEAPSLLAADRADRSDFLRSFYRRYEDAPVDQLDEDSLEHFSEVLLSRSFPAAVRRVREHRALGHRTLLITGALDLVIEPLRPLFDDVVCARLGTTTDSRGRRVYTGQLDAIPPTAEARARIIEEYCDAEGLDVAESVAYADSSSDLPMLEAVGFPVAVNPEPKLAAVARKRGWLIEDFRTAPGFRRPLLPIGPRAGRRLRERSAP